jgi:hypothetical protein
METTPMRSIFLVAVAMIVVAGSVEAQQAAAPARVSQTTLTPNRDVVLEIPELSIDSLGLTVSNVRANVALTANAMNFVTINAGVDVGIKQVQLGLVGVFAEAYLYVDLDNVARIVGRVVQTLDRNPQILTQVLKTVETAATSIAGPPRP